MEITHEGVLVVAAVAAAAPMLANLTARVRLPIVVAEMALGMLVGPDLLGLADTDAFIEALATYGLAFLFFMAGYEIDFARVRGAPARIGISGWLCSVGLGLAVAFALWAGGVIDAPVLVALALSTTALGTLMPILRDAGVLGGRFGDLIVGSGAAGEFGPVVAISVILAVESGEPLRSALLIAFALIAIAVAWVALRVRPARVVHLVESTMTTSGQLAVRLTLVLVVALVALASDLGLDLILGAFAAGIIVGLLTRDVDAARYESKLDALGFGFLIPIFFIATGIDFDLDALTASPSAMALVPGFAVLFLLCRGLPAWLLTRRQLAGGERLSLAFFSAAALPLVVAITELGTETGVMRTDEAVALVGAAMLSVLAYPLLALAVRRRGAA